MLRNVFEGCTRKTDHNHWCKRCDICFSIDRWPNGACQGESVFQWKGGCAVAVIWKTDQIRLGNLVNRFQQSTSAFTQQWSLRWTWFQKQFTGCWRWHQNGSRCESSFSWHSSHLAELEGRLVHCRWLSSLQLRCSAFCWCHFRLLGGGLALPHNTCIPWHQRLGSNWTLWTLVSNVWQSSAHCWRWIQTFVDTSFEECAVNCRFWNGDFRACCQWQIFRFSSYATECTTPSTRSARSSCRGNGGHWSCSWNSTDNCNCPTSRQCEDCWSWRVLHFSYQCAEGCMFIPSGESVR